MKHENKKNRGKFLTGLSVFLLLSLLLGLLAGCGGTPADEGKKKDEETPGSTEKNSGKTDPTPGSESGFPATVTLRGVAMTMGEDAAPVLSALGEWKNYVAKESCAFKGQDKEYTYNGFVLMTYPDGDTDRISSVILTSDAATTGEGMYIGAAESEIEKALGSDCEKKNGSYLYKGEKAQLLILVSDGKISSIQYSAVLGS